MAKRFTDTELSDKEWFMRLSCRMKCAVRFVFDKCDNAGVWTPNYTLAAYYLGENFNEAELLEIDNGRQFEKFGNKIFVIGFCSFQYGELTENCKPHKAIIGKLIKYGLYERVLKGYGKGIDTLQEKEQDKDKEKNKVKEGGMGEENILPPVIEMQQQWALSVKGYPKHDQDDLPALLKIGQFIAEQQKVDWLPRTPEQRSFLMEQWKLLANWLSQDDFYKSFSLASISKTSNLQTIWQKSKEQKNAGTKTKSGNSRSAEALRILERHLPASG